MCQAIRVYTIIQIIDRSSEMCYLGFVGYCAIYSMKRVSTCFTEILIHSVIISS